MGHLIADAPLPARLVDAERARILLGLLEQFTPGSLIDLGCGTGWFSELAAARGWRVTAIDARPRGWVPSDGLEFRHQDVRDADVDGYDVVLCLGLFYHLEAEAQVALLAKCAGTPLILDTHVALKNEVPQLGFPGTLYGEGDQYDLLSAWGNKQSFWPTVEGLREMLAEAGYSSVTAVEPWYHHTGDRTFFTCLP